jgi:hypothetical protein
MKSRYLLLLPLVLSACSSTDETLRTFGLVRDPPDEYTVTTRAPLSVPPDFALRPPAPGASRPQELAQRDQARLSLVPDAAIAPANPAAATPSPGQQALLEQAGPTPPANIRNRLDADAMLDKDPGLTDRLMFWKPSDRTAVVDAAQESQRLHRNAALGAPETTGDTPIIQPKSTGWLSGLF